MAKKPLSYEDFRPLRSGESGYSKTRRQYVSPSTGEIISIRRFQTLAHGGVSYEKRRKQRGGKRIPTANDLLFQEYYNNIVVQSSREGFHPPTKQEARKDQEWQLLPTYLRSKDKKPGGRLSQALIWLGRRDPNAWWGIGETPD